MDTHGRLISTKSLASWVLSKPPKCIHNPMVAQLQRSLFLLWHNQERKHVNLPSINPFKTSPTRLFYWALRREVYRMKSFNANLSLHLSHFPSKRQLSTFSTSTFHLHILPVHFWPYKRGDFLNLPHFYRAHFTSFAFVGDIQGLPHLCRGPRKGTSDFKW